MPNLVPLPKTTLSILLARAKAWAAGSLKSISLASGENRSSGQRIFTPSGGKAKSGMVIGVRSKST